MAKHRFDQADIPFDGASFTRRLLHELVDVLQDVIGPQEARGFVAVVGARLGDAFNAAYRRAAGKPVLSREEVAEAVVDLKRRVGGDFYVIEQTDETIVLGNRRCPFGDSVQGRPSLCMMTSNVFGRLTAENLGYAKVSVEEAFARGDRRCLVRIALENAKDLERLPGREYFRVGTGNGVDQREEALVEP